MTYKEDEKILDEYDFTKGDEYDKPCADDDAYDGGWENCQFGQVSTRTSDRPENSGDNITSTYQYGEFWAIDCGNNHKYIDTSLFEMFEWDDF